MPRIGPKGVAMVTEVPPAMPRLAASSSANMQRPSPVSRAARKTAPEPICASTDGTPLTNLYGTRAGSSAGCATRATGPGCRLNIPPVSAVSSPRDAATRPREPYGACIALLYHHPNQEPYGEEALTYVDT